NNKRNHFINYLGNVFPENWYENDNFVKIYKCALAFEYNRALMRIKEYDSTLGKRISIINRYYNEQMELNPNGANPEPTQEQLETAKSIAKSITRTLFYYKIVKNTDLKPKFFEYTTKKYYEQEPICHTKSGKEILKYLNLLPEAEDIAGATVNYKTNDDRDKLIDYIKECLVELNENYGKAKIEDAFLRDLLEEYRVHEKNDKER
ncbi:MAG: hypothetical protein K6E32_07945, partial [Lachnospiraceae bacterium]|nr:hypothetical protein [Lachnospiraceae bacterium]